MPSVAARQEAAIAHGPRQLAVKQSLCPESSIQLQWSTPRKAGSGLVNLGNTCFMNSVLQALTHTAPLAELCLSGQSLGTSSPEQQHLDPIAATQAHIRRALTAHTAVPPKWHARNLKIINRRFRLGRQEDAHEYLRCVLDAMHEAVLKHIKPKPPPEIAATTFVQRIFGGKLRSQITCEGVDYTSSTFDPFLDLSLEINKASSLTRALQHFTAAEVLDGDNRYRCPKNNQLVRAYKRISIDAAPNVLTVHLKRFDFFGRGHKLSKKVEFGFELDLGPYMTQQHHKHHHKQQHGQQQHHLHQHQHHAHKPVLYDLYAVLVHLGHSLHSGHYVCYVKAGNGTWYLCDDHRVAQVGQRHVEGQQAYILFYIKRQPKAATGALPAAVAAAAQNAAVAANRLQQQQQHPYQQQQQLVGSGSTQTPLAGSAAAAFGQGRMLSAASLAQQQQQQPQPGSAAGQPGSISAAEGGRKVVTSSTESTATISPGAAPIAGSPEVMNSPVAASPQRLVNHSLLHHHHHLHSKPINLSKFERHKVLHQRLARQALRHKQQLHRLGSSNGSNGHAAAEQDQHGSAAAGASKSAVVDLGVIGSKRRQQQQWEEEQPQQLLVDLAVVGKSVSGSQQQEQQQAQSLASKRQQHTIANQQQQQQQPEPAEGQTAKRHKPGHHGTAQPAEKAAAAAPAPVDEKQLKQLGKQQLKQAQTSLPQQQPQTNLVDAAAGETASRVVGGSRHQQQQQPSVAAVTGAAALELFLNGGPAVGSSGVAAWAGGDAGLAAQAAALQQAHWQKRQRERDEWDAEYDRGRVKKVRSKAKLGADGEDDEGDGAGVNRFQRAWDEQLPQKARAEAWKADSGQGSRSSDRGRGGRGRGGRFNVGRGAGGGFGRGRGGGRGGRGAGGAAGRGRGGGRGGFGGGRVSGSGRGGFGGGGRGGVGGGRGRGGGRGGGRGRRGRF